MQVKGHERSSGAQLMDPIRHSAKGFTEQTLVWSFARRSGSHGIHIAAMKNWINKHGRLRSALRHWSVCGGEGVVFAVHSCEHYKHLLNYT